MRELLEKIPQKSLEAAKNLILLDTCFVINTLEHHKHLEKLKDKNLGITSFNMEELLHVEHKLGHEDKRMIRGFLKHPKFCIVNIPVHPGNREEEIKFVNSVDKDLLKNIHDPSDAVLIAVAIKTNSTVLTKDKHHLFTCVLEEFLKKYSIQVYKDLNSF
ncbi:PIN domain-containing protein [Candidatus Woesearchaeota archaeon]|nr:PIN domain-containing protein [Candidatus Woesearchaeota archaeon]